MPDIILIIICAIIVVFNAFLIFIYVKSKFNSYPYYFNIFYCTIISLNNIIRLIHMNTEGGEPSGICKAQAILLTLFDKLILTLVCCYSVINYLGTSHTEYFNANIKVIFILLLLISLLISILCTIIFINQGYSHSSEFCYAKTRDDVKIIFDTIITTILFAISLLCLIILIKNLCQLKKKFEYSDGPNRSTNMTYHICRFCFDIFINIILFVYVILLINKVLPDNIGKDLIYIIICLIIEVFFTVNKEFIKETKRIITCQKINEEKQDDDVNEIQGMNTNDFGDNDIHYKGMD